MSLTASYKTDSKKETEGVRFVIDIAENGTETAITVARTVGRNERYNKALERIMRPHNAKVRNDAISNSLAEKLLMQAFVEGAMVSWENVLLADVTGNPEDTGYAEFSFENATKLLTNLPDLFTDLQAKAGSASMFRGEEQKAAAKN